MVCALGETVTWMLASLASSAEAIGATRGAIEKTINEIKNIARRFSCFKTCIADPPYLAGGVDLSKGCPLMFTNQADTNCSAEAPQLEQDSTDWHVGESAWYLAPQPGHPRIEPRMGVRHDQHVGACC